MDLIESYKEELQLIRKPWTRVWVGAFVLALLLLPWYAPEHITYIFSIIFIYTVGVQGQNILIGYTGQISFGQAGFLAIGAFTFGHMSRLGIPWPIGLACAGLAAGLFGLVVGFPSLRLKGPYLAIATLGFGVAVYQVFVNSEVLSGGRMGLIIQKLSPLFGLSRITFYYYFNFLIALIFTIVSSFYTGVQGGLYGLFLGYLEPNMFTFMEAITLFVAVIIGGLASVEGSIMGAAFVILVPQVFSAYRELVPVVYGVTILIILIFEPFGLYGRWFKMRLYLRNWPFR
jgi:branched-chain amino acid transport system permease protein